MISTVVFSIDIEATDILYPAHLPHIQKDYCYLWRIESGCRILLQLYKNIKKQTHILTYKYTFTEFGFYIILWILNLNSSFMLVYFMLLTTRRCLY